MMEDLLFVSAGKTRLSLERAVQFGRLAEEELILPSPRHGLRGIMELRSPDWSPGKPAMIS